MDLVADRFAVNERGDAVDLATAARVTLIVEPAGDPPEQVRWSERCDMLHTIRHHAVAPLVDFGLVGARSRFEAWGCAPRWRGDPDEAHRVSARAARFLRAMAWSVTDAAADRVGTAATGVGLWVPDARSGYPSNESSDAESAIAPAERGVRLIQRPALAALAEMFRPRPGSRSHIASVWGPPQSGKRCAIETLARSARLEGFVPVAADLIDSPFAPLWHDRSVLLIAAGDDDPWTAFLRTSLRIARPHVALLVGVTEYRGVDGVPLRAVTADALFDAVRPALHGGSFEAAARRIAEHARGLPGRFVRELWRRSLDRDGRRGHRSGMPMAAEQPAAYLGAHESPTVVPAAPACPWPAPGELAALRRKMDNARTWLAAGRHASGLRELRQAVSALARRGAWMDAADGAGELATALLRRGRAADAQKALDEAREYAAHAGGEALLVDLATLSGDAWIDRARLDEAETILAGALAAARATADTVRIAAASLALSRCLFWRGRFAEASACLERFPDAMPARLEIRRAAMASRLALARRDFSAALADAPTAYARALVHLNVGDLDAADREAATAIVAARVAHDPLRALRARLVRAEVERRRGRTATATAQLERLRRAVGAAPPLVRARWQLAAALCARGDVAPGAIVDKHVSTTGLGALPLYAPPDAPSGLATPALADTFLEHVLAILRVCQIAEDEVVVLRDVCIRVRLHLHAAAVAFVAARAGRPRVLAADGAHTESDIAERVGAAGITIAPHRRDDRVEAAAPVMYGGASVAALCARWTLGSTYDLSGAASALTMTATAAAPIVAMVIDRREDDRKADDWELLGISAAMVDLRRSVDCAASAPFAVVIDGESGSGKELVARAIHRRGGRRHRPFCTLNCAALPDDLVETELFGHARGSFTGAVADRAGVFEDAHGGTLFLDEIGELSPRAQAKVLRVIQEGELRRVGETLSRRIDVRIIAATNRDLRREVDAGRFRLDLLYRLDVIHIAVPRLRDRRDDIAVLADRFWRDATARVGSRATLSAGTLTALTRYDWPGNVRELQNVLAALAVRCPKRGLVPPSALPPAFTANADANPSRLDAARRTFEERFVRAALVRTGGHRGRAAEELGVTRQGLAKLMSRLGIST